MKLYCPVFVVLSQCVPDGHNLEISQDKAIPSFTDQQMFFDRDRTDARSRPSGIAFAGGGKAFSGMRRTPAIDLSRCEGRRAANLGANSTLFRLHRRIWDVRLLFKGRHNHLAPIQ
jgi:hypothetical protein